MTFSGKSTAKFPTITETELGEILSSVKSRYVLLFTLLAGTGLRIGEALGLKTSDLVMTAASFMFGRASGVGRSRNPRRSMPSG